MPDVTCFACERDPLQQCPRCGRPYCEDHGEDFCAACLEPSSAVPSVSLYRGSLLALVIASVIALVLILQPGGDASESAFRPNIATATSPAGAADLTTPTSGPGSATTPGAGGTSPAGATTPGTGTTPAAGPTTAPGQYVVVSGDTLSGICSDKIRRPGTMTVPECVEAVRTLNSLSSDNLEIGQTLRVPQ